MSQQLGLSADELKRELAMHFEAVSVAARVTLATLGSVRPNIWCRSLSCHAALPVTFSPQLLDGQARLESFLDEGPHLLIRNAGMRSLWRIYCRTFCLLLQTAAGDRVPMTFSPLLLFFGNHMVCFGDILQRG